MRCYHYIRFTTDGVEGSYRVIGMSLESGMHDKLIEGQDNLMRQLSKKF